MILWINGPFGVGKTTLGELLVERMPGAHLIDTERVGYLLRPVLDGPRPVKDFQDWPAWRALVVTYLAELHAELGTLVVPQSVYVEAYWVEIRDGLAARGVPLRAVTLDVDDAVLVRRIRRDLVEFRAARWRLDHIAAFREALPWLRRETEVLDASASPAELAGLLLK